MQAGPSESSPSLLMMGGESPGDTLPARPNGQLCPLVPKPPSLPALPASSLANAWQRHLFSPGAMFEALALGAM